MRDRKDLEAAYRNADALSDVEEEVKLEIQLDIRDLLMELVNK